MHTSAHPLLCVLACLHLAVGTTRALEYVGCFSGKEGGAAFSGDVATPLACQRHCDAAPAGPFPFVALGGNATAPRCFCRRAHDEGRHPDASCPPCAAKPSSACGGRQRYALYRRLGPAVPPPSESPAAVAPPATDAPRPPLPAHTPSPPEGGDGGASTASPSTVSSAPGVGGPAGADVFVEAATERSDLVAVGGQVAAVASATVGVGAASAARLVLASQRCTLAGSGELPPLLHPLRFTVWGSSAAGAAVGNLGAFAALVLVGRLLVCVLRRPSEQKDIQAVLRFPSFPLLVFLVLYQGASYAGLLLIVQMERPRLLSLGIGCTAVCLSVPFYLFTALNTGVTTRAVYLPEPTRQGRPFVRFLAGPGEWVSTVAGNDWACRYSSLVRSYRRGVVSFSALEFAASFALSATLAMKTPNLQACGHARAAAAAVLLGLCAVKCVLRPHARARDNALDTLLLLAQSAALGLSAAGFYTGDVRSGLFTAAEWVFVVCVFAFGAKAVLDAAAELLAAAEGARRRLQAETWRRTEAADKAWASLSQRPQPPPVPRLRRPSLQTTASIADDTASREFALACELQRVESGSVLEAASSSGEEDSDAGADGAEVSFVSHSGLSLSRPCSSAQSPRVRGRGGRGAAGGVSASGSPAGSSSASPTTRLGTGRPSFVTALEGSGVEVWTPRGRGGGGGCTTPRRGLSRATTPLARTPGLRV